MHISTNRTINPLEGKVCPGEGIHLGAFDDLKDDLFSQLRSYSFHRLFASIHSAKVSSSNDSSHRFVARP